MKYFYKRIIAGVFAVVTLFFACVPSSAAGFDVDVDLSPTDLWSWAVDGSTGLSNFYKSIFDDDVCSKSTNPGGRHNFIEQRTTVDGKTGLYYICEYCGKSAGEVGNAAYQEQVSTLPAPGYNSSGVLSWRIPIVSCELHKFADPQCNNGSIISATYGYVFECTCSITSYGQDLYCYCGEFVAPITGKYSYSLKLESAKGSKFSHLETKYGYIFPRNGTKTPNSVDIAEGSKALTDSALAYIDTKSGAIDIIRISDFYLYCEPLTLGSNAESYDVTTRPTSITGGNYGIVGDDGTINTVSNTNQIINETNNTYYNPATGETSTITDWSYNYEDRSYTVTLESGDTATVTYGDENISITENNVVEGSTTVNNYTVYYMMENPVDPAPSDSPSPSPSACSHTWTETSRTDPTCITPGSVSYSCSQCGETKTETLKATGHSWQVDRTIQTTYDEQGNLLQQGYTIYKCAVCGEQYKDEQGNGPPGGAVDDNESIWDKIGNVIGTIFEGFGSLLNAVLGKILDALTALAEMLMEKLAAVVEVVLSIFEEVPKLFGGFLDFLGVVFPFLPSEITLLLTFGIVAVVFIGIIKALRR